MVGDLFPSNKTLTLLTWTLLPTIVPVFLARRAQRNAPSGLIRMRTPMERSGFIGPVQAGGGNRFNTSAILAHRRARLDAVHRSTSFGVFARRPESGRRKPARLCIRRGFTSFEQVSKCALPCHIQRSSGALALRSGSPSARRYSDASAFRENLAVQVRLGRGGGYCGNSLGHTAELAVLSPVLFAPQVCLRRR